MKKFIFGLLLGGFIGLSGGIYILPVLTAEAGLSPIQLAQQLAQVGPQKREGEFSRERQDSDAFHWGEGHITLGQNAIVFEGEIAPGPDYRLYLTPQFVETEADFIAIKAQSVQIGMVKSYDNFALSIPASVDISQYDSVIVWCEAFGQFITSAQLK